MEPTTTAKVQINTSKGAIEIALWAKEFPLTCRRFLQNCLDGKYDGLRFTKVIKDYLIQIDGNSNELEYDIPDEFNSRVRFGQKGLLAAIKEDENMKNNHSVDSWFITLTAIPEFNNKYNVFGKLVGDSIYNVANINDGEMKDDKPIFPAKIINIDILEPYFELQKTPQEPVKKKVKTSKPKVKLAYDEENNDDDLNFKMKSAHELLNDTKKSKNQKLKVLNTIEDIQQEVNNKEVTEQDINQEINKQNVNKQDIQEVNKQINNRDIQHDVEQNANENHYQGLHRNHDLLGKEILNEPAQQSEESSLKDTNIEMKEKPASTKIIRDPSIDSDYDSNLDLSDSEFDHNKLHSHKFKLSTRHQ